MGLACQRAHLENPWFGSRRLPVAGPFQRGSKHKLTADRMPEQNPARRVGTVGAFDQRQKFFLQHRLEDRSAATADKSIPMAKSIRHLYRMAFLNRLLLPQRLTQDNIVVGHAFDRYTPPPPDRGNVVLHGSRVAILEYQCDGSIRTHRTSMYSRARATSPRRPTQVSHPPSV
jgi:hypothetical protein